MPVHGVPSESACCVTLKIAMPEKLTADERTFVERHFEQNLASLEGVLGAVRELERLEELGVSSFHTHIY